MIKQPVACGCKHLCHDILVDITKVGRKLVGEQSLIDNVLGNVFIPKGKSDEKPRIAYLHLVLLIIGMHGHSHMRIIGMVGEIDGQAVLQISQQLVHLFLVFTPSKYTCNLVA